MTGADRLAAGARAEARGEYPAALRAYRAVAAGSDELLAAEARLAIGRVSWRQGRYDAALVALESALVLAARAGATELWARIESGIGAVHHARGEYASARRAYAASLARTADEGMRGKAILNLGVIESIEGNHEDALEHYERALRLLTRCGDTASAMRAVHDRGIAQVDLRQWDAADASFLAALAMATDAGDREMTARTLMGRSEVLVERGAMREAIDHCDRALVIFAELHDGVGRGEALHRRGRALGRAGELAAAERSVAEAARIATRAGARLLEAEAVRDLGILRGMLGDVEGGEKLLRQALALFTTLGIRREAQAIEAQLRLTTPARTLARLDQR